MKINENQWKSMKINGNSLKINEKSMKINGNSLKMNEKSNENK